MLESIYPFSKKEYTTTGKTKLAGGANTTFVWDGSNMVLEYTNSAASGKVYIYGFTLISQGNSLYYIYNAHGDVVKYMNSSGTVLKSYEYDAFGEETNASATDANPFRYAGQYFDSETGTYYLRARYYSPALGRFTQADKHWHTGNMLYGDDPLMLTQYIAKPNILAIMQSGNLYNYCFGNPVVYVDTNGNWVHIAIGAVIGLAVGGIVSAVTQYSIDGTIDWGRTAIAAGTGALSGALAATGVGLAGQIAGNAVLGAVSTFGDQLYVNEGDITEANITDIMIGAFLGAAGGALGGAGGGSKHLDKLTNQLFKRIGHAFAHETGKTLKKEISNAISYYLKSASKQDIAIIYGVLKSYIPTVVKGGKDWLDKAFAGYID